jgi:hypothetical protein
VFIQEYPSWGKGSEAASKCHVIAETFGQQGVQLKNPQNCNLPVNNGWAVYKSHDRIGISSLFCEKLTRKRLFLGMLKPIHKNFSETPVCQDFQPLRGT